MEAFEASQKKLDRHSMKEELFLQKNPIVDFIVKASANQIFSFMETDSMRFISNSFFQHLRSLVALHTIKPFPKFQ